MENMDKGLTVPKYVLKNWPKNTQMPQNLSAQFVFPITKVWNFNEKRLHWASLVCEQYDKIGLYQTSRPVRKSGKFPKSGRFPSQTPDF
jgi:hypothetical protein